jgi:hypothetical protein
MAWNNRTIFLQAIRRALGLSKITANAASKKPARLGLEALEVRDVPSTATTNNPPAKLTAVPASVSAASAIGDSSSLFSSGAPSTANAQSPIPITFTANSNNGEGPVSPGFHAQGSGFSLALNPTTATINLMASGSANANQSASSTSIGLQFVGGNASASASDTPIATTSSAASQQNATSAGQSSAVTFTASIPAST